MKVYRLKRKNVSRAAVLVTSLAGALVIATINPMAAAAHPRATPTAGAAYTVTCTTPAVTTTSDTTST